MITTKGSQTQITIIAEKPSVARDIAAIVGANNRADGYLHGGGYAVTWAFGHLVQLAMPEEYGAVGFNREHLPIIPDSFKLVVRQVRDGKTYKSDSGAAKQLKIIGKLFEECDSIVVATDAGREGELIFRYIYNYLGCHKPFERLWISSLTDSAIREGLKSLKEGVDYDNLYEAARSRSEADWLVGINASQALTLSAGGGVYSLGRVQTPTLKMICERYRENKGFAPVAYYKANVEVAGVIATSTVRYDDPTVAEVKCRDLQQVGTLLVQSVEQKEVSENPPLLYDLTALQKDANKRHGLTAQETLSIAQTLYEGKFITYPRTGSRYISEDVFLAIDNVVAGLQGDPKWSDVISSLHSNSFNRQSVNGAKVTDHHALLPTEVRPKELSAKEQHIYDMIVGRTIEALMPTCVKRNTTITFNDDYSIKATQILLLGWREVLTSQSDIVEDILPTFEHGQSYPITSTEAVQKHTKPKAIHTESSLLSAMESAGKEIENEAERAAMKELGLGTPATRAATIETLISRGYIIREKRSLVPTEKGMAVYDAVRDMQIADVQLTGEWENGLCSIERGTLDSVTFDNISREYTRQITAELLSKQVAAPAVDSLNCPKCGASSVRIFDKIAKCTDSECGFVLFREVAGKRLTDKQIEELITKGKTATIKGFKSKAGKSFDAALILDNSHKVTFQFAENRRPTKKSNSKFK